MIQVKYNGVHTILFETTTYAGEVANGDIIEVEKVTFDKKLKNVKDNGVNRWTKYKEKAKKKEDTETK